MKKSIQIALLTSLVGSTLVGCGGSSSPDTINQSNKKAVPKTVTSEPACATAWSATTAYIGGQSASYDGVNYVANWWTQNNNPSTNNGVTGTGQPWTEVAACGGTSTTTPPIVSPPVPPPSVSNPVTTVIPMPGTTSGAINFHLLLGVPGWNTAQDQLVLTGGNYNDLIMSNFIAGVMYGHLIQEYTPGMQFNKDYLYGSIMGQLLQENLATEYYSDTSNLIDPTANQQAVMGVGQGGPYQINGYAMDYVAGTYAPAGHALINYVALQKNIGYTMAAAGTQYSKATPASFNNKYYGPMLTAFFHFNDYVSLIVTGTGPNGWVTPWQPEYNNALTTFKSLPNNFLDILLNTAYNQGYYGGLVTSYSNLGATATAATVAQVDSFNSVWGINDTYQQYPYQVRYYLDQFYDNPIPTSSVTTLATPTNHIAFNMTPLQTVFGNVVETLAYENSAGQYVYITAAQAQTAFNTAMTQANVNSSTTLDLSNASDRAQIFSVLENAIGNL